MDRLDRKILIELQRDASTPLAEIAARVGLSASPCWRRIQKLERAGVIAARVALIAPEKVGLGLVVFAQVRTADHSTPWLSQFARIVETTPEIVGFYRMTGEVDYLLKIVVPDIAAYDAVYKRLIQIPGLADVSASFTMETIKETTALPLDYAP